MNAPAAIPSAEGYPRRPEFPERGRSDFPELTRIRKITSRNGGRSLKRVAVELRQYLLGWKGYFRLADTPKVFRELDKWIRHRVRQLQLKQWKRGTTTFRELRRLGVSDATARAVAVNARRWWHNSTLLLNAALPASHIDALGIPRLAA